jgi:hypothetical protein
VYTAIELANGNLMGLEIPLKVPESSLKQGWNLPDVMSDYDCDIALGDGILTISAGVGDEAARVWLP